MNKSRSVLLLLIAVFFMILTATGYATVGTDQIADGAVTTPKIADGAVTSEKIGDGAVSTNKVADGSVTDAKISGPISASKISSSGLDADTVDGLHSADLAPHVHTHSQSQVIGLDAALAGKADESHNHDGLYQKKYANVAVVAKSGGDYTDPATASANWSSWCPNRYTQPCLLKIMPGVYDIGANVVAVPAYIDIEGSGRGVTVIRGSGTGAYHGGYHVIDTQSPVEVRDLTVENYGVYGDHRGIIGASRIRNVQVNMVPVGSLSLSGSAINADVGEVELIDVKVNFDFSHQTGNPVNNLSGVKLTGSGGTALLSNVIVNIPVGQVNSGIGLEIPIGSGACTVKIKNSEISGADTGLRAYYSSVFVSDSTIEAKRSYGSGVVTGTGSTIHIDHSSVSGSQYSVGHFLGTTYVAYSKMSGPTGGTAPITCIGNYDDTYNPVTCP